MTNPFLSGRIPHELHEKVKSHCKEAGESKTDLLIKALSHYLNFPIPISKPSAANLESEVKKEEFEALKNRVSYLEKMIVSTSAVINTDNSVISQNDKKQFNYKESDNNKLEIATEVQEINAFDNDIITSDNKEISKREITIPDNEKAKNQEVNTFDNDVITSDNREVSDKLSIYKSIGSKKLSEIANTTFAENTNLKTQAFAKATKKGYEITESIKFTPSIEITFKRGISINNHEYKIYCEGIDENKKPIWTLEPVDDNSYQLDVLM